MPVLLQINTIANMGSTGRIAEEIGLIAMRHGWESYIAFGRGNPQSKSRLIRIGNKMDMYLHAVRTRICDSHGLSSEQATRKFIEKVKEIRPDVIHLHNIHGYYVNYKLLFDYLKEANIPVVWTLHDCWAFTGHCAYFSFDGCEQWKSVCSRCGLKKTYPASLLMNRSARNFNEKRQAFCSVDQITIVPVSEWLGALVKESFLGGYPLKVIHNGIDIQEFSRQKTAKETLGLQDRVILLGVANGFGQRKGFADFIRLRELLPDDYQIVMVGMNKNKINQLPHGIMGISHTNSVRELAAYYSVADVFLNLTYDDNYPSTNLEAMACGTPVITYKTGGSVEAVDAGTGVIVDQGDMEGLVRAIETARKLDRSDCRKRAESYFDKNLCFQAYMDVYKKMINI